MAHAVIMPALGMAQDTGMIVSWLKAPGDAVKAGDPLMEVETDKAVMEVEAAHDGYLSDVRFQAGDNVPVGDVVAMIVAEAGSVANAAPAATLAKEPAPAVVAAAAPAAAPTPVAAGPAPVANAAPVPAPATRPATLIVAGTNGRILASPKARRLAAEQGIGLKRLAATGHPQPFHVADLTRLKALPAGGTAANRITATARPDSLKAFRDLLTAETGGVPDAALWAAFAAGALRQDGGANVIRVETHPGGAITTYADPDLLPLAEIGLSQTDATPDLILRDLTGTSLTEVSLASDPAPVLCIARGHALTLTWPEGTLSVVAALALVTGVANRIEQPLRHLL